MRALMIAAVAAALTFGSADARAGGGYREIFDILDEAIGVLEDLDRLGNDGRSSRNRRYADDYRYGGGYAYGGDYGYVLPQPRRSRGFDPYGDYEPRYERPRRASRSQLPRPYLMEAEGMIVVVQPTPYGYADILDPDTGEHLGTMDLR